MNGFVWRRDRERERKRERERERERETDRQTEANGFIMNIKHYTGSSNKLSKTTKKSCNFVHFSFSFRSFFFCFQQQQLAKTLGPRTEEDNSDKPKKKAAAAPATAASAAAPKVCA